MNREKHECSLLNVVSDAGSTPAASTTYLPQLLVQSLSNFHQLNLGDRPIEELGIFTALRTELFQHWQCFRICTPCCDLDQSVSLLTGTRSKRRVYARKDARPGSDKRPHRAVSDILVC